mgnify:CR=1 FL=1
MMIVTLEEMKQYLRVDFDDDDFLIETLITSATRLCMDITRQDQDAFEESENAKPAVYYAAAYLYEHREEADHHAPDTDFALSSLRFQKGGFLMNIELLNVRIYIQKNEVISDSIGNRKNAWKDYYTCYATVSAEAGKESTGAGLIVDDSKIDFKIRYCKKAAALTSTGYRVQFGSELYDILAVDHMNFKRKCIKLSCQKVRR